MKLFGKRAAILLIIAIVALSFSGCIDTPVADTSEQVPGAQMASFPLTTNYIQDAAITSAKIATSAVSDTQLAANAIVTNYTTNTSTYITSTAFLNATSPGAMVLNRAGLVVVTYNTQLNSTGNASMRLMIDAVEQAPGIVFMGNGTNNLAGGQAVAGYTWVNASLLTGTHYFNVQANVTSGTLGLANATLLGVAYPK